MKNRRILIWGGTAGLGKALEQEWKNSGCEITAIGRDQCDVSDREILASYLKGLECDFDTVVYCAGTSAAGKVLDVPLEAFRKCYEVNFFAPLTIFKHFFSNEAKPKKFAVILSGTSEVFLPGLSAYSLSKRALRDLLLHIRMEYPSFSSSLYAFYPGGMNTEFDKKTTTFGGYVLPRNSHFREPIEVAKEIVFQLEHKKGGRVGGNFILRIFGFFQNMFPEFIGTLLRWRFNAS